MALPSGQTPPNVTLSRLYIDGMPLDDLQVLYDYNTKILGGSKWNGPNQFWASPPRHANSTIRDTLEVSTGTPSRVNHFEFQVSKFPCRIWLQYRDTTTHEWKPVKHKRTKRPVIVNITESVPRRIHAHTFDGSHRHPHHRAAGHWQTIEVSTKPVDATRFRLVITRLSSGNTPVEVGNNKPTPYSIAVKDFQFGYEVKSRGDITGGGTQVVSQSTAFSSTTDLLGSSVEFALTEYDANDILWPILAAQVGVPKSERDGDREFWKSEPQPFPYAVVNLYVDARGGGGEPQSVDRFYVDTPTSGVGCNLYYSNTDIDPSQGFEAREGAIRYPAVQGHGSVTSTADGILFASDVPGFLDLDRKAFQPDDAQTWWEGLEIQPQFDSTSTADWVILATQHIKMTWSGTALAWVINVDGAEVQHDMAFGVNQVLKLMVVHGPTQATIAFDDGWSTSVTYDVGSVRPGYETPAPLTMGGLPTDTSSAGLDRTRTLRFGADLSMLSADLGLGGYRLRGFVMKQEEVDASIIADWLTIPAGVYLVPSDLTADEEYDHTHNSLVRIDPFYRTPGTSSRNPYGVVGGPAAGYDSLVWIPINRDFRLQKGFMRFNPVKAKYFKFEFSNLSPQPYASYVPMTRLVRLFTADTIASSMGLRQNGVAVASAPINVNINSANAPLFADQTRVQHLADPSRSYIGYTPTEALYSSDPGAQDRLAAVNPAFRFQPWHRPSGIPRFVKEQKHYYETVRVTHKTNVAYFVGLSSLRMFKVDYTATDDTDAYLLNFHDQAGLSTTDDHPWEIQVPNGLVAPETPVSQTTSQPLLSRRNVRGIQFATTQTPAAQVLADPDFNDPDLEFWTVYGGAQLDFSSDLNSDIGSTVRVTRVPTGSYWFSLEDMGTWNDIEATSPTWDDLESAPGSLQFGGVQGSAPSLFQPTTEGRIYAAARVYAPTELEGPLHLQIITSAGNVLAEAEIMPKAGGITEWFTGYTLGTALTDLSGVPTWDGIEAEDASPVLPTWDDLEAQGSWNQVMGDLVNVYDGPVTVRLFQQEPTHDVFYVDNIALYEDPIVWEFSNDRGVTWWPAFDIRNNPNGVLLFPDEVPDTLDISSDLSLSWRVTTHRPGVHIGGLFIRPWYSTLRLGVPIRDSLAHGGPNLSEYDQYPSIAEYAPFKTWDKPIPQDWWFNYRQWLLQGGIPGQQEVAISVPPTVIAYLSDSLLYTP